MLHNDSSKFIRGIKLLSPLPNGSNLKAEIPTRLEADQKVSLSLDINVYVPKSQLIEQFGTSPQQGYASLYFPVMLQDTRLEFQLKNQRGRTVYQYTQFVDDNRVVSTYETKRKVTT